MLPGPQADAFTSDALDTLQSAPYTVGQQSDRMGFRLEGPLHDVRVQPELVDQAVQHVIVLVRQPPWLDL